MGTTLEIFLEKKNKPVAGSPLGLQLQSFLYASGWKWCFQKSQFLGGLVLISGLIFLNPGHFKKCLVISYNNLTIRCSFQSTFRGEPPISTFAGGAE